MQTIRYDYKLFNRFDYMLVKSHTSYVPVYYNGEQQSTTYLGLEGTFLITLPDDLYREVEAGRMKIHPCTEILTDLSEDDIGVPSLRSAELKYVMSSTFEVRTAETHRWTETP